VEAGQGLDWRLRPESPCAPGRPARYGEHWYGPFLKRAAPSLQEGAAILDVGGGRDPAIPQALRPADCEYVGLDVSAAELAGAPAGSYDAIHVADVGTRLPELEQRFDLIVSWQVLEHVPSLEAALWNVHAYAKPGGRLVALISGRFSAFAVVNQLIPGRVGAWSMKAFLGRDPETVFEAHYDRCYYSALDRLLRPWSSREIVPLYRGADYFGFAPPLERAYVAFENWLSRSGRKNFATHYLVTALK
jgi:SAM-dependent methyltransferase